MRAPGLSPSCPFWMYPAGLACVHRPVGCPSVLCRCVSTFPYPLPSEVCRTLTRPAWKAVYSVVKSLVVFISSSHTSLFVLIVSNTTSLASGPACCLVGYGAHCVAVISTVQQVVCIVKWDSHMKGCLSITVLRLDVCLVALCFL